MCKAPPFGAELMAGFPDQIAWLDTYGATLVVAHVPHRRWWTCATQTRVASTDTLRSYFLNFPWDVISSGSTHKPFLQQSIIF
jgi:hypothetical protein